MDNVASIVCGYNWAKTIVAPENGAKSNQVRANVIVEKPQIFFFSALTNSAVHVVRTANVQEMADFDIIDESISKATRRFISTEMTGNWLQLEKAPNTLNH